MRQLTLLRAKLIRIASEMLSLAASQVKQYMANNYVCSVLIWRYRSWGSGRAGSWGWPGSEFPAMGPATENARRPKLPRRCCETIS